MNTLPLKAISHDEVLAQNILLGTARELEFRVGRDQYGITFYTPEFTPEPALSFSLQVGEHLLGIKLERVPSLVLEGSDFPASDLDLMPPDVAQVVFEAFLCPYLAGLSSFFNTEASLHSIGSLPEGLGRSYGVTLSQNGKPAWARARVFATGALWGSIAHKLQPLVPVASEDYSSIPVFFRLQVGSSEMSLKKFQTVELQDILLFDKGITPRLGSCVVHAGEHLSFHATLKENTVTLESIMNESTPKDDVSPTKGAGASPSLDAFSLHLTFEVGEKEMPVGELQSLQAGYTFEMDSPFDCPVTIKANGSKIGTGELVQVADRIGVRVVDFSQERLAPSAPPVPMEVSHKEEAASPEPAQASEAEMPPISEKVESELPEADPSEDDTRDA